jgi:hypothetical protein
MSRDLETRIRARIGKADPSTGCIPWTGEAFGNGYGLLAIVRNGKRVRRRAHRLVYELLVGPIPEGLTLDHLCRNRICVNTAHLEPVTQAINSERAAGWVAGRCRRGHELTDANIYVAPKSGKRQCRACWASRKAEARAVA